MRAILTLEVDFDPTMTDAESLALATDRLLETAFSTPGILSDQGDPTFSACSVDGEYEDYWGEDHDYPIADWQQAVAADSTRLGYWAWIASERDARQTEDSP